MIVRVVITYFVFFLYGSGVHAQQDQTSPRANTLLDDADDIQKQLDNEARDRIKYGGHKTIWVINFPDSPDGDVEVVTRSVKLEKIQESDTGNVKRKARDTVLAAKAATKDWSYADQSDWYKTYPDCGGRSQSPVDLPYKGLAKATGARKLTFNNYNVVPSLLEVANDGRTVSLYGSWKPDVKPFIYGGAAHARRYIFHSMTLHWPSEHAVGGLQYPLESQFLHISAEYKTMEEAVNASASDPLAFLGLVTLYKFGNHTQEGLRDVIHTVKGCGRIPVKPLKYYNPPLKEYACYQGSLTAPPCKEAVLWLVRAKALSVTRSDVELVEGLFGQLPFRVVQPMNDRKTYFFQN